MLYFGKLSVKNVSWDFSPIYNNLPTNPLTLFSFIHLSSSKAFPIPPIRWYPAIFLLLLTFSIYRFSPPSGVQKYHVLFKLLSYHNIAAGQR